MIERITVTGEETNKYFIHNNGLAKEWEKLAKEYNGEIKGAVNGQILEFDCSFQLDNINIHIHQIRQLSNKHTGALADEEMLMTKNTIIQLSPVVTKPTDWKIIKNNIPARIWYNLRGFSQPLDFDSGYLLVSRHRLSPSDVMSQKEFNDLMKMAELRYIEKKDSLLQTEFFTALGTDSTLKIINTLLKSRC